ncbi:MAG: hypothetical protein KatS3mg100_108 [Candidatus Parcubacteria bacterium]|nr:MAG: hypothetical protein KatS3mg100_108 [Candidatus Parcubacteria bacterium]
MGTLAVVATPLGNLEDITLRALRILREADLVLAEDTRRARALLSALEIRAPRLARADEAALARGAAQREALRVLQEDGLVAFLTDAGTPGVADPGWRLVASVLKAEPEARLEVVPGPSALTAALAAADFPVERFVFFGYPPRKKGRAGFLTDIARETKPSVFFESSHRIARTLAELARLAPERSALWAREITKAHEQYLRGSLGALAEAVERDPQLARGEHTLVLAAAPPRAR